MHSEDKRAAANAAAEEIQPGMIIGLGTGTTVAELIPILALRVRDGLHIQAVATSIATEAAARAAGIAIIPFEDRATIDLTIDGVDEIDDRFYAIKGEGGALLREKIVATASHRMVAIADGSKRSAAIGRHRVAVEILPFARSFVLAQIVKLGATPTLRIMDEQPARSDQGNFLADCTFPDLANPAAIATRLSAMPGLLGHGLFLTEIDALYIASNGKVTFSKRARRDQPSPSIERAGAG